MSRPGHPGQAFARSDQRRDEHRHRGTEPDKPDERAPGRPAQQVAGNVKDTRAEIGPGGVSGDGAGLVGQGDHQNGDGEQDQAFEMVGQRALRPAGLSGELTGHVARAGSVAGAHLPLCQDRIQGKLQALM